MKLSNALTAISCILLLSQTMHQPAFADYNPNDTGSGGDHQGGGDGQGGDDHGGDGQGGGHQGGDNQGGGNQGGGGGQGNTDPTNPGSGNPGPSNPGPSGPSASSPSEPTDRNHAGDTLNPTGQGGNFPSTGLRFNVRLGYQGFVALDSCISEKLVSPDICGVTPNVASLPSE